MDKKQVLERCKKEGVRFLRLAFTDIDGIIKNVEVPASQFDKALDGQISRRSRSTRGRRRTARSLASSATCTTPTRRRSPAARAWRSSALWNAP
jgi:glutamine synthetase